VNEHPDLRRLDDLPEAGRLAALEHLRVCAACRRAAVADDPARVFALLAVRPIPEEVLDRVVAGVSAAVREGGRNSNLPFWPRRTKVVSAWAAAAALAAILLLPLAGRAPWPGQGGEEAVLAPAAVSRGGAEIVSSPGATQVVNLTVGDTQLVMIFDPRLEL
jgi:hypothetical protein